MATDIGKVDFSSALAVGNFKNLSDSTFTQFLGGSMGELVVAELWGKYGELCRRGYVYAARSAAATIPVYTTLTNGPVIANWAGSGKMVIPLKIMLTPAAIGTPIITGLIACWQNNIGAGPATAGAVPTFTNIASVNCKLGGPNAVTGFAAATVTYTAQPAAFYDVGLGYWLSGTAATGTPVTLMHDFDGAVMLPQGSLMAIGGYVATSITYCLTMLYAEIPTLVS